MNCSFCMSIHDIIQKTHQGKIQSFPVEGFTQGLFAIQIITLGKRMKSDHETMSYVMIMPLAPV